jgi:peptidyl-prolyl cis-trans isomerase SurA
MIDLKRSATTLIAIVLSVAPATSGQIVDEIAVVVNDDIILKSDINNRIEAVEISLREQQVQGAELQRALASAETNVVRDLIDEALLLQKAEEFDMDATVAVVQQMDALREDVGFETLEQLYAAIEAQGDSVEAFEEAMATQYLTQQVLNQEVDFQIMITTEELRARYDAELDSWDRPEGVAIQEIVFGTEGRDIEEVRQRATEVLERARDG